MSANANGTPTTNFSIPKFNTPSDAPNGKGVNEMMDALDVLFTQRAPKITTSSLAGGPPGSPVDGDLWYATSVNSAPTWVFQYNSGWTLDAFKWQFVGGTKINVLSGTSPITFTSGSYLQLTGGATVTAVRAGFYDLGGGIQIATGGGTSVVQMSAGLGNASMVNGLEGQNASGNVISGVFSQVTQLAAGTTYNLMGASSVGAANFYGTYITLIPVRIS